DPDDKHAALAAIAALTPLHRALAAVSGPRTDVLRAALGQLARGLEGIVRSRGQREVPASPLEHLQASTAALADLVVGARRRLGLPVTTPTSPAAMHALALSIE